MTDSTRAQDVKACCAAAYSTDLVGLLLGDSYHPGGLALTRKLADATGIGPGRQVVDVASGRGASALVIAGEYDASIVGLDLSAANVALASGAAQAAGLADRATFRVGDAEQLPLPDHSVDIVLCECALCTFPDKPAAAREFARVLRPGGRVGITDVTADPDRLPPELTTLAAWIACIADARPATEYAGILEHAGFRVTNIESYDAAAGRMIDQIEARLEFLRLTATAHGVEPDRAEAVLSAARTALAGDALGYAMIVARKEPHDSEA